mmetsp:Transcript_7319/g.18156  ORF Transcript_7319/g.18156 Transcript_7319/m.18156 type:complete len:275 (-) Transcript_7319:59-883(-)
MAQGEHQHGGGAVHAVPRGHEVGARLAHVGDALGGDGVRVVGRVNHALALGVDAKDGAGGDARVQVRRPVDGVEAADVVARHALHRDGRLLLLGHRDGRAPAARHRAAEHVVRDHVELLLLVAARVGVARHAQVVGERRGLDERGYGLARGGHGREQRVHVEVDAACAVLSQQPGGEGGGHGGGAACCACSCHTACGAPGAAGCGGAGTKRRRSSDILLRCVSCSNRCCAHRRLMSRGLMAKPHWHPGATCCRTSARRCYASPSGSHCREDNPG